MKIFFDPEIHSKYSRAVSKDMTPENIALWSLKKGIDVAGTGDFTHPAWIKGLKEKLEPAESGIFKLKNKFNAGSSGARFLLQGEVSCIYSKNGKVRRAHNLIFAPSFEAADKINKSLSLVGNIRSDGRPILGLDVKELLKILKNSSPEAYLIPAHVWTPWFGMFGSKSGFNSLEECFDELTPEIFAVETGLSSDPSMNRRISFLDKISLISGSDAHSLRKIGREATVVNVGAVSYINIFGAIKSRDPKKFLFTVEFFPEEGKYHYDGHRDKKHSQTPEETKKSGGRCLKCGRPVTVGVMSRISDLADKKRPEGWKPAKSIPFKKLIPLEEIISYVNNVGVSSKKVRLIYDALIKKIGNEFIILLESSREQIVGASGDCILADTILKVREGRVKIEPGYDGEYGRVSI